MEQYLRVDFEYDDEFLSDVLQSTAPKDTGKYAKSWAVKTVKETSNTLYGF